MEKDGIMNLEEVFGVDPQHVEQSVDYRTEEFFLDIAENISAAMKSAGIESKAQLATALGVTPGRVSAFFGGYKKNVELRTIVQYAIALGVQPHDLCSRRTTREMRERPLFCIPGGYQEARITPDVTNDDSATLTNATYAAYA
ncbi:MAG TPA: helix-turn-helix transcriptional regulator [Thermoanaerobaculia bacterium]|nr:helix-turn-helix transcriptional regulator [Thermoanaerobaculia bacterium]